MSERVMRSAATRGGLTLIELLVVVTLLGFIAATVTVRLQGSLGQAMLSQAASQWEFVDTQLRAQASRKGVPVSLYLEIGTNELQLALDPADALARTRRSLGRGVKVARLQTATREVNYGPATIEYSDQGTTETYVVEIVGTAGTRWLLVAGLTGQIAELADAKEADDLLAKLLPTSVHVD